MHITRKAVSPAVLFVTTWILAHIAAFFGPSGEVYQRYDIVRVTFTVEGSLWVVISTIVFLFGTVVAGRKRLTVLSHNTFAADADKDRISWQLWKMNLALPFFFIFTFGILFLLLIWTFLAINEVGSLTGFITETYRNWSTIRRLWPAQKPFVGARLLYTGLISVPIFSASGLALYKEAEMQEGNEHYHQVQVWVVLLILGLVPLMILPLIVSQRVLLASALVGATTAYTTIRAKGVSLKYPIGSLLVGFAVWTAQEIVRAGLSTGTIVESISYGLDRILFYFTNDIGNLHRGIAFASEQTHGFKSFSFIFRYLFISDQVKVGFLQPQLLSLEPYQAGGGFTALGIPYIDFGIAGLILIFIWGYVAQVLYHRSKRSIVSAQMYGLIAASIVLSWHSSFLSSPTFWLNILLFGVFITLAPQIQLSRYTRRKVNQEENS